MKEYLLEKLSEVNRRMSVHQGNANNRLASEAKRILLLPSHRIPQRFQREYQKLLDLIRDNVGESSSGLVLASLRSIQNATAAKYIKLLSDIESALRIDLDAGRSQDRV